MCVLHNSTYFILGYKVSEVDSLILPVLQMSDLKQRKVTQLAVVTQLGRGRIET